MLTSGAHQVKTASDKVATLEEWKKNQKAVDGREEDDSNDLDDDDSSEPLASFEKASAAAIANAKKRVGDK